MSLNREKRVGDSRKYVSVKVHKNWCDFIHYCEKLRYGEIQSLRIQDGIPQIAEVVKKKINFSKGEGSEH
jgi:hypothetical protein